MATTSKNGENLTPVQIVGFLAIGLATIAFLARDLWWPIGEYSSALSANVGLNACNRLNGAYAGKILGVMSDPVNRSGLMLYSVQRPDSRPTYAPVEGVTVTAGQCPDGSPR